MKHKNLFVLVCFLGVVGGILLGATLLRTDDVSALTHVMGPLTPLEEKLFAEKAELARQLEVMTAEKQTFEALEAFWAEQALGMPAPVMAESPLPPDPDPGYPGGKVQIM